MIKQSSTRRAKIEKNYSVKKQILLMHQKNVHGLNRAYLLFTLGAHGTLDGVQQRGKNFTQVSGQSVACDRRQDGQRSRVDRRLDELKRFNEKFDYGSNRSSTKENVRVSL